MASDILALKAAIEARVKSTLDAAFGAADRIAFPNAVFTPPDTGLWARSTLLMGESVEFTAGVGVSGNRSFGVLVVDIFGPPGEGLGDQFGAADDVRDAFSRVDVGAAHFMAPSMPREIVGDPLYGHVTVRCPFDVREA